MNISRFRFALLFVTGALLGAGPSLAQGEFVNFEDPQIAPIDIARVGGTSYVLACNTPDNSIEIYDAETTPPTFKWRIPVGLSPVTVKWNADLDRFFTCNFLGDSVSAVRWDAQKAKFFLDRTVWVGDEPTDIAFLPGSANAVVSLHSRSKVAYVDEITLLPISTGDPLRVLADDPAAEITLAVKAPRRLAVLEDAVSPRLLALNTMGGNTEMVGGTNVSEYDVDLYVGDLDATPANAVLVDKMGSTNFAMAVDQVDKRAFVVGAHAQNKIVTGMDDAHDSPLGFVRSFLWVVDLAGSPAVRPEPDIITGAIPTWASIDLNQDYPASVITSSLEPVFPDTDRVSQPTDVVLVPDPLNEGRVKSVVVACFGSDLVLILTQDPAKNGGWERVPVNLAPPLPPGNDDVSGPRGLAYDEAHDRIWVLNRLDNSLAWFTPGPNPSPGRIDLKLDPTPDVIRDNRKFLYSAHKTSGNKMVACASCHVDGRTDSLAWDLTDFTETVQDVPPLAIDTIQPSEPGGYPQQFPLDKGPLVTQSLQGLVNSDIDPPTQGKNMQYVTTNAPYHWRGDRVGFDAFNAAFVVLQGMTPQTGTTEVRGIPESDMIAYRNFIETIHYPPNPEQPRTRTLTGNMGTDPNNLNSGRNGKLGLKVYHLASAMNMSACAHCHTLPEGSSNTFVLTFSHNSMQQPLENAAIRGLFQKEKALVDSLEPTFLNPDWTRIADTGLVHGGVPPAGQTQPTERSINDFNGIFNFGKPGETVFPVQLKKRRQALNEFVRGLDWGVAPMIGRPLTMPPFSYVNGQFTNPDDETLLDEMEASAMEANSGVAVYLRTNNGRIERGYWFDCSQPTPLYRKVAGGQTLTRDALLAFVDGPTPVGEIENLVVFQAVPTGSERRIAHKWGDPKALGEGNPTPPTVVRLLSMVPNTSFVDIAQITDLSEPANNPELFRSIVRRKTLANSAIAATADLGVPTADRHEPPRRFRVAGAGIEHGAKLLVHMSKEWSAPDGPSCSVAVPCEATLELDLAATGHRTSDDLVIWETAEELDPSMVMAFLNGSPEREAVNVVLKELTTGQGLDADRDNKFGIEVVNQNGQGLREDDEVLTISPRPTLP